MALAATLRCPDNDWAPLPDAVAALLEAAEQLWSDGSSSSSSSSAKEAPMESPPPGLESSRVVRRVSRQRLQVPGLKSEQFATTPPRAVTTEDGPPVQERPRPRKMSRSFTTEPARSTWEPFEAPNVEELRQMAQLQLQQQLQQFSMPYDQQVLQYQQLQQLQQLMNQRQIRAQSLREPPAPSRALRRTASAASPATSPPQARCDEAVLADSEAELQLQAEDVEVVVGPTQHAVLPLSFEEVRIDGEQVLSRPGCLSVTDVRRLAAVKSFGSLLHGSPAPCRPCMFERVPGRCKKAWLCDFCHLHAGRKKKNET